MQTLLAESLPAPVRHWPEYMALQRAHEAFHAAARRWWEHAPDTDPQQDPAILQAHGTLLGALHRLLDRLCAVDAAESARTEPPAIVLDDGEQPTHAAAA